MHASLPAPQLLQEGEGGKGCLMAVLRPEDAAQIVAWADANIAAEDLGEDGREHESHVTVLYGFNDDDETVEDLESFLALQGPVAFTLRRVSRFPAREEGAHEPLKIDVESDDLETLHYALREFFGKRVEVTFPDYHPHLTLAYVKPGACSDLDGHARFDGATYVLDRLVYSRPGSEDKVEIPLTDEED